MVPLRKKGRIGVPEMKLFKCKMCVLIPVNKAEDPVKMVAVDGERMTFSTVIQVQHGLKGHSLRKKSFLLLSLSTTVLFITLFRCCSISGPGLWNSQPTP